MSPRVRLACLLLVAILTAVTGCSQFDLSKDKIWPWTSPDDPQSPGKIVAVWSDTVLYQGSATPTRGFAARLMFYGDKGDKPVKVDGTLIVYGFDETNNKPDNTKPDKKYVFTPEQFAKHYSKSDIGHSYSVWVPWDTAGGPQEKVSLIVRFVPREKGSVVVSEQATQLLAGPKPANAQAPAVVESAPIAASGGAVRTVSYEEGLRPSGAATNPADAASAPEERIRTTTIDIPLQSGLRSGGNLPMPLPAAGAMINAAGPANLAPPTQLPLRVATQPASPATQTTADNRWSSSAPPPSLPTRFSPATPRVLGGPIVRPRDDRGPTLPGPAGSPSGLPPSPPAASGS